MMHGNRELGHSDPCLAQHMGPRAASRVCKIRLQQKASLRLHSRSAENFALAFYTASSDLVRSISKNNTACYSCVALNYRTSIPSRNGPLPPPQDPRNLSELFDAMRTSGVHIPPLTAACADLAPSTSPTTFMRSPVVLCKSKTCSKFSFSFKGEKVVVRNCVTNTFATEELLQQIHGSCSEHSSATIGRLDSVSLCECEHDLCNSSERHFFHWVFLLAILFL